MAGDATTIARPYAEAAFQRAVETNALGQWADMFSLLGAVAQDVAMQTVINNPKKTAAQKAELLMDIGGSSMNAEGNNLIKLLADNGRLAVLPEIATAFAQLKAGHEGTIDVEVATAFPLSAEQEQTLASALKKKLGRDVRITSTEDNSLIGGFRLRAGDMVIDGSVSSQISQLANQLGI
jgi:F-type H+-transporting ATPase subunit delta